MPKGFERTQCLVQGCGRHTLCHGRCVNHFRQLKREQPAVYSALMNMPRKQRLAEIEKSRQTEIAKAFKPWTFQGNEDALAAEFVEKDKTK